MKYVDFSAQTILFILTAATLVFNIGNPGITIAVLTMQTATGAWQLISALWYVRVKTRYRHLRKIHLLATLTYVIILLVLPATFPTRGLMLFWFIFPAWSLAIFYFTITTLTTFCRHGGNGRFLPHLSF